MFVELLKREKLKTCNFRMLVALTFKQKIMSYSIEDKQIMRIKIVGNLLAHVCIVGSTRLFISGK